MQGKIIKAIAGFFYVSCEYKIYECKAKGILRNKNIRPIVGDLVDFDIIDLSLLKGNIININERKNELIRPLVSNIDLVLVVQALVKPLPSLYLLDKYLLSLKNKNLEVALVWNKSDLINENIYEDMYKKAGYKNFSISAKDDTSLVELKDFIKNKSLALAGPSGVGKSTLINNLVKNANMLTSEISKKVERGKHTTRHSEIFVLDTNTYLYDTPGFTSIDISNISSEELRNFYNEFQIYEKYCKFQPCFHIHEPNCEVKKQLDEKKIAKERYENYLRIYKESVLKNKYRV